MLQRLTLKTEASLRLRLMQDGISELGFSMRIDSQSELGGFINILNNSELQLSLYFYVKGAS